MDFPPMNNNHDTTDVNDYCDAATNNRKRSAPPLDEGTTLTSSTSCSAAASSKSPDDNNKKMKISHNSSSSSSSSLTPAASKIVIEGKPPATVTAVSKESTCTEKLSAGPSTLESTSVSGSSESKSSKSLVLQYQNTLNGTLDEFVCPITLELPLDPVMAEDGRIYERSAIEDVIERCRNNLQVLRSPITNKGMGPKLSSAIQVRNVIEKIIKSGAITVTDDDKKAENWIKRIRYEKEFQQLKSLADIGDLDAIYKVANCYDFGKKGITINKNIAFTYYKKAAECGHVQSMACAGCNLLRGIGVQRDQSEGMCLLSCAAGSGSAFAAYILGLAYRNGWYGLKPNIKMAQLWFEKVVDRNSEYPNLSENVRSNVKSILQELQQEQQDQEQKRNQQNQHQHNNNNNHTNNNNNNNNSSGITSSTSISTVASIGSSSSSSSSSSNNNMELTTDHHHL